MENISANANTNRIKLSSPWEIFYKEVKLFFEEDPDVIVKAEDEVVRLYVNGQDKANALQQLIPEVVEFGNIKVTVEVIPSNAEPTREELLRMAFASNPIVKDIVEAGAPGLSASYVLLKAKVVQFFSDNLADVHGFTSTLYENIAKDIFLGTTGALFCTERVDE